MIEIHWELIPLIICLILGLLAFLFERHQDWGKYGILCAILSFWSFLFYCVLGIIWVFKHIKII